MTAPSVHKIATFRQLLGQSLSFYRDNIKRILQLVLVGVATILPFVVAFFTMANQTTGALVLLPAVVLFLVGMGIVTIALYVLVGQQHSNRGIIGLLGVSLSKILPLLWVGALTVLVTMAGFLLFVIPGILCMVWFAFSYQVVIFENKRGVRAITQSWDYVDGYWWAVVGRSLLFFLTLMAVGLLLGLVGSVPWAPLQSLVGAVNGFLNVFIIMPITAFFHYYLYRSLVEAHQLKAKTESV